MQVWKPCLAQPRGRALLQQQAAERHDSTSPHTRPCLFTRHGCCCTPPGIQLLQLPAQALQAQPGAAHAAQQAAAPADGPCHWRLVAGEGRVVTPVFKQPPHGVDLRGGS